MNEAQERKVIAALVEFIDRAAKEGADLEETRVLPEVARALLSHTNDLKNMGFNVSSETTKERNEFNCPIISVTVCPYCETQRNDSNLDGRCRFCNTPLLKKEIELPELSSSEKECAKKYLEDHRPCNAESKLDLNWMLNEIERTKTILSQVFRN